MKEHREQIIESLSPLIADLISKAKAGRVRDADTWKLRLSTVNSLANLIRAYNQMLKDSEMEEIMAEIQELKNDLAESKERYK